MFIVEVYLGRQPILDRHRNVYGYELLHRASSGNSFDGDDGAAASLQVITSSFLTFGIAKVVGGKRGFINVPRELLVDERVYFLPPKMVVIEVLETVERDPLVIAACRRLRESGYLLALDDFVPVPRHDPLVQFADIIKVDFRAVSRRGVQRIVQRYAPRGVTMLAEKVETEDEYRWALKAGFTYFQGFFFARPDVMRGREVPGFKQHYARVLVEANRPQVNMDRLEALIKQDLSLCHRLLRYVNSAAFHWRNPISSIKQAMVLLGEDALRKWTSLAALPGLASDKPNELIVNAMVRGRFCESVAAWVGLPGRAPELFVMGMFSHLDGMMDMPLDKILGEFPLQAEVKHALLGTSEPGAPCAEVYALIRGCERGDRDEVAGICRRLGMPMRIAAELYWEAVCWSSEVFRTPESSLVPA